LSRFWGSSVLFLLVSAVTCVECCCELWQCTRVEKSPLYSVSSEKVTWGYSSVVECLPPESEDRGSIPLVSNTFRSFFSLTSLLACTAMTWWRQVGSTCEAMGSVNKTQVGCGCAPSPSWTYPLPGAGVRDLSVAEGWGPVAVLPDWGQ
jgi:hypothetical protein